MSGPGAAAQAERRNAAGEEVGGGEPSAWRLVK